MNKRKKWTIWLMIWLIGGIWSSVACAQVKDTIEALIYPETLNIGTFYHGTKVVVEGNAPKESNIIVRFVGISKDLHLKKKGKIFGLLWMNMDSYTFKNVPNVFLVYTEHNLKQLSNDASLVNSDAWKLGLESLSSRIKIEPKKGDSKFLAHQLIKLKEKEGLYGEINGVIRINQNNVSEKSFKLDIPISSSLSPGNYKAEIYAIQNGKIIASLIKPIKAELKGFPAFLLNLAYKNALIYGLLATVVAIAGGLLMSFVFGSGRGAH